MKSISLHVPDAAYQELKSLAGRQGRPVAELIRQAMLDYLERDRRERSVLDLAPHRSGRLKRAWTRSDIAEEMLGR